MSHEQVVVQAVGQRQCRAHAVQFGVVGRLGQEASVGITQGVLKVGQHLVLFDSVESFVLDTLKWWGRLVRSTCKALSSVAIRNWSSFVLRTLPRSVRPKLRAARDGRASANVTVSTSCGLTTAMSEEIFGSLMI